MFCACNGCLYKMEGYAGKQLLQTALLGNNVVYIILSNFVNALPQKYF